MTLRLHWSPDSANLVIRLALEALELPYESVRINRAESDHKRPEYLTMNPQGLIPVLEDDDLVLFETGAILWHLAERAGRLGPDGPPMSDAAAKAEALKWTFYISNTVHADLRTAFYAERYVDTPEAAPNLRRGLRQRMRSHCDLVEGCLAEGCGLAGEAVTLPDLYMATCLRWAQLYPTGAPLIGALSNWPRLYSLSERIEAMPNAVRAFEAEHIPPDGALTAPQPPTLPRREVTGV